MNSQNKKDEDYPLKLMKYEAEKLGIDFLENYGLRNFFHNGDVFGITTNKEWNSLTISEPFILHTKLHYYDELSFITKHKMSYIIRTKELANNPFLVSLADIEMCNGIGIYITNEFGRVGYYFTAHHKDREAIHFFINNVYLFDKVVAAVENRLMKEGYWRNNLTLPQNKKLFSTNKRQLIFSKEEIETSLVSKIFFDGRECVFTQREMQILKIMRIRNITKEIAQILEVSTRTVEWHIQNLKNKIGVSKKNELVDFSRKLKNY